MYRIRKISQLNPWVKSGLWLIVCFSLMLSSCSSKTVEETIPKTTPGYESAVILPEEIIKLSDLGLGTANISGMVKEEALNWMDQPVTQYTAILVDAIPFLTVQADLSGLQIFQASAVDENGGYVIDLPQQPAYDEPLQVMMLAVEDQDCLIPGNQFFYCWDAELSSIAFEDVSQSSVSDGQVLVWAADDQQTFPNSIGADGMFFTDDDELESLEPGYTIVDFGVTPFSFDHQGEGEMALYSNYDPAIRDLSELTYTEAFDRIFDDMQEGYAFNGIEVKEPDWNAVYELIYPQVQEAEQTEDVNAWISALNAYTQQFSDSHVSISGDVVDEWVEELYSHGLVYYFTPMTNGDIIYTHGPMQDIERERFTVGYEGFILLGINDVPIEEEIKNVIPLFGSYSTPDMFYRAQVHDITHTYNEKQMEFQVFTQQWGNQDEKLKWGQAYSISADDFYTPYYDVDNPISYDRFYSGVGLIQIHSDGHSLLDSLAQFRQGLEKLSKAGVDTLIIDMRDSEEYRFLNYAGYFTDTAMDLGEMQWQQFGNPSGKTRTQSFVSVPQKEQFYFERIAILTGEHCKNACEEDVYALSLLPQSTVYASTSTFGSAAITEINPYRLPGGVLFNSSTGSIKDLSGELLIEGQGVQQDVLLEEKLSNYLLDYDWRLPLVDNLLFFADVMDVIPESTPVALNLTEDEVNMIIDEIDQRDIEYLANEAYPELFRNINYSYHTFVEDPGKLIISEKWCTNEPELCLNKGELMDIEFVVDGEKILESYQYTRVLNHNAYTCWVKFSVLDNWDTGMHKVVINTEYQHPFFRDGGHSYSQGIYTEEYTVVVKKSE